MAVKTGNRMSDQYDELSIGKCIVKRRGRQVRVSRWLRKVCIERRFLQHALDSTAQAIVALSHSNSMNKGGCQTGLNEKTVVVTGAAMGIGREICAGFISNGSRVIGVDVADMSETAKYVNSLGKGEMWNQVTIDLASPESVREGCKKIMEDFPSINALVNNAALYGGLKMTPMEKIDLSE